MKILYFKSENFKRISVVEIIPKGDVVEIKGKNGNGKTSVLDAIWVALAGMGTMTDQPSPIRKGEKRARIELHLGEKTPVLIVERRISENTTTLSVRNPDGSEHKKPQAALDRLFGALGFDPLEFTRLKPAEQLDVLRGLVKIDFDFVKADVEIKRLFDQRTDKNRDAKSARARAEAIKIEPNLPDTPPDTTAILKELADVDAHNAQVRGMTNSHEYEQRLICDMDTVIAEKEKALEDLRAKRAAAQASFDENVKKYFPLPPLKDASEIQARFQQAANVRGACEKRDERRAIEKEAGEIEAAAEALTAKIDGIKQQKAEAIAAAEMPIDGIGFGEDHVTFDDLPFSQASDAERLRVSTAIAAALNPTLRVIRIRDGSLLDDDAMAWMKRFATRNNLQIWIERVGDEGETGVILEDGHVRGQEIAAQ